MNGRLYHHRIAGDKQKKVRFFRQAGKTSADPGYPIHLANFSAWFVAS